MKIQIFVTGKILAIGKRIMNNVSEILAELQKKALHDVELKKRFLETKTDDHPLRAFCRLCRELGYEIYEMDVINAGEETYAAMRRATNGGGENSPLLAGEDDYYELFFAPFENKRTIKGWE